MSEGVWIDPDLLGELAAMAERLAATASAAGERIDAIAVAGMLDTSGLGLPAIAVDAARLAATCVEVDALMSAAAGAGTAWRSGTGHIERPDDGAPPSMATDLTTLRAHRDQLDVDDDGTVDEDELRASVDAADPQVRTAASAVLGGASSFPSAAATASGRPTVPELLAMVNSVAPAQRDRLVAECAAEAVRSGTALALGIDHVAADVALDTSEREEARLLSDEPITVPMLERLRAWELAPPDLDASFVAGVEELAPAGTAAVSLTYRSEEVFHEYTIDPLPDLPAAVDDVFGGISIGVGGAEIGGNAIAKRVAPPLLAVTAGLWVWNRVDDLAGDEHQRLDTNVVFDVGFHDASGRLIATQPAVGMDRTGVTSMLFPTTGSVTIVPVRPRAD